MISIHAWAAGPNQDNSLAKGLGELDSYLAQKPCLHLVAESHHANHPQVPSVADQVDSYLSMTVSGPTAAKRERSLHILSGTHVPDSSSPAPRPNLLLLLSCSSPMGLKIVCCEFHQREAATYAETHACPAYAVPEVFSIQCTSCKRVVRQSTSRPLSTKHKLNFGRFSHPSSKNAPFRSSPFLVYEPAAPRSATAGQVRPPKLSRPSTSRRLHDCILANSPRRRGVSPAWESVFARATKRDET